MKRIRLLIYDGKEEWLKATLSNSLSANETQDFGLGTIRVIEDLTEISDIMDRINVQKEIDPDFIENVI